MNIFPAISHVTLWDLSLLNSCHKLQDCQDLLKTNILFRSITISLYEYTKKFVEGKKKDISQKKGILFILIISCLEKENKENVLEIGVLLLFYWLLIWPTSWEKPHCRDVLKGWHFHSFINHYYLAVGERQTNVHISFGLLPWFGHQRNCSVTNIKISISCKFGWSEKSVQSTI